MEQAILIVHAAVTLFMTGVIWFVQIVHYPLFRRVGIDEFPGFCRRYATTTSYVVIPPMLLELGTGLTLFAMRPPGITDVHLWLGLAFLIVIWLSTFFLQAPKHAELAHGYDLYTIRDLTNTNWLRTVAWSARGVLVLYMLSRSL